MYIQYRNKRLENQKNSTTPVISEKKQVAEMTSNHSHFQLLKTLFFHQNIGNSN